MYPESLSALVACRRPLLLQGPMGPFFSRLADYLTERGAIVGKVHFNGGDEHFYRHPGALRYDAGLQGWSAWLADLLLQQHHDAVVLFGQARPMHRAAIAVARALGRRVFVFEEGYIRPHYVTLEPEGVNGHTSLPRDADFYQDTPYPRLNRPRDTGQRFSLMAWYAAQYTAATFLLRHRYPHQVYHRDLHPLKEPARWAVSGLRKLRFAMTERHLLERLSAPAMSKTWFLLALQVHNDAQLIEHSPFDDVPEVIREVVGSFSRHAPASTRLVIKHHPMDRAYRDYTAEIAALAKEFEVDGRVMYVHDLHLPTLLKHARGVVTVNSTTGLQAMYHETPVCVLGECLYAMPGLVHTRGLATFWSDPDPVQQTLYRRFRAQVIRLTQINASFYGEAPGLETASTQPIVAPSASSLFSASMYGEGGITMPAPLAAEPAAVTTMTIRKIIVDQPVTAPSAPPVDVVPVPGHALPPPARKTTRVLGAAGQRHGR